MAVVTTVPLNTALADLDETLRELLKRELGRHGFDRVEVAFDAPDKEWAAALAGPAVNVFLYDLREAKDLRPIDWGADPADGRRELRPPLRIDASYAVTAWTRAVEDEHRLLSQTMAVLYAFPILPPEILAGTLRNGSQRFPLRTRTAQDRHEDASDFWSAVGGQYKASFNYVVTLSCESGTMLERGPEVRTRTVRLFDQEARVGTMHELHRSGGVVSDGSGHPVSDAWVTLPERGSVAVTDAAGRYQFDRLPEGSYRVRVRGPAGEEAEATLAVPGIGADVTLGRKATAKRAS